MGRKNRNARKARRTQRANQMPINAKKAAGTVVEQPTAEEIRKLREAQRA